MQDSFELQTNSGAIGVKAQGARQCSFIFSEIRTAVTRER